MGGVILLICLVFTIHTASLFHIRVPTSPTRSFDSESPNITSLTSNNTSPTPSITSLTPSITSLTPKSTTETTTPLYNQGLLSIPPSSSYEVTENIIDIPDNRTLPPIIPNYTLVLPLNIANTSVQVNKEKNGTDVGDENKVKRTTFTYIHYSKDPPEKEKNEENAIVRLFRGLRRYVININKKWIDGLHDYVHRIDDTDNKQEHYSINYNFNGRNGKKYEGDDFGQTFHDEHYDDEEHFEHNHDQFKHEFTEY